MSAQYDQIRLAEVPGVLSLTPDDFSWTASSGTQHKLRFKAPEVEFADWLRVKGGYQLRLWRSKGREIILTGFQEADHAPIKAQLGVLDIKLESQSLATHGRNWGQFSIRGSSVIEVRDGDDVMLQLPARTVTQALLGLKGHEVTVEFKQDEARKDEYVSEIRLAFPQKQREGSDADDDDAEGETEGARFHADLTDIARLDANTADPIASFEDLSIAIPRGRFNVQFFADHLRLQGKSYKFLISYKDMREMYLLPVSDMHRSWLLIALDPKHPAKRGMTTYQHIVIDVDLPHADDDDLEMALKWTPETKQAHPSLGETLKGSQEALLVRLFEEFTQRKVTRPDLYKSATSAPFLKCVLKSDEGYFFPLRSALIFLLKPTVVYSMSDLVRVEFARVEDDIAGRGQSRFFDLTLQFRSGHEAVKLRNISKQDHPTLQTYLQMANVRIKNPVDLQPASAAAKDDAEAGGDTDESDDDDFDGGNSSSDDSLEMDSDASSSGSDDDDGGDDDGDGDGDGDADDDDDDDAGDAKAKDGKHAGKKRASDDADADAKRVKED